MERDKPQGGRAGVPRPAAGVAAGRSDEETLEAFMEREALERRLGRIRHKLLVLSGKGGVGKSTVAVHLARALAAAGKRVGLLDVDIHGPSVPTLLNLGGAAAQAEDGVIHPVQQDGLKVMSIGFLLRDRDDAVIWRGPLKMSAIRQFLQDVDWGDLDYLVIDAPPGTGDEPLSVAQLAAPVDGAVVVTTPQAVATADVRKSISFCRLLNLPVLGVVENMSGFACPHCGAVTEIFKAGGGEDMAREMNVPFLGRIPLDPAVGRSGDDGAPATRAGLRPETAQALERLVAPILALSEAPSNAPLNRTEKGEPVPMKIAIPLAGGALSAHFGHCEQFALLDVDEKARTVTGTRLLTPPPHEPGVLPRWLHEQGATVIIAGGMGQRAQSLFTEQGIRVVVGAPSAPPDALAAQFLAGTLTAGPNVCDH